MSMLITKADGNTEPFHEEKLRHSLRRSGASDVEVKEVTEHIEAMLYSGIRTQEIYRRAFELLRSLRTPAAARYSLRRALFNLGPTGFPFERFLARLFALDGYATSTNLNLQGKCALHEIDVAAYKPEHSFVAEAKFHARPGLRSDLQVAMYSHARLLDLRDTKICADDARGVQEFWLITNTKFTSAATQYAECSGVPLLSWDYPKGNNLHNRIERAGVYPVTVLQNLSATQVATLIAHDLILCTDILKNQHVLRQLHLNEKKIEALLAEIQGLCREDSAVIDS